jgi:hypothetical protein
MKAAIVAVSCALTLATAVGGVASTAHAHRPRAGADAMLVVIRSEGPDFVLDTYYEGNRNTTKPITPKEFVPFLQREVPPQARVIDLTGKIHVVQW